MWLIPPNFSEVDLTMNSLYQRICQIAVQLQQEGKTPSLALVRARLGSGTDPVKLFSAYQQWRNSPPTAAVAVADRPELPVDVSNDASEIEQLRADVARLETKLDQILVLLQTRTEHVGR